MTKNHKKDIITILLLLLNISLFAIQPDTVYVRMPEQLGLMYKSLYVKTSDGYQIATWFFPAQEAISDEEFTQLNGSKRPYKTLDKNPRPTIIICNGDAGNMSYFQLALAEKWTAMGFNVVTFDWRGFGASSKFEMNTNYLCYTEMLTDYEAVIEVVAAQPEVKRGAIAVMGWSTGAYLSMIAAYNNELVDAFIGRSLATDFEDFIPLVMQVKNKTREQLIVPDDFPAKQMPIYIAKNFKKPVFLINGDQDLRTPVWMSEKILSELPAETPRELMIVKGAGHGGKEDPIILAFDNFITHCTEFLNKNLK